MVPFSFSVNDAKSNTPTIFPASSLIIIDDLQYVKAEDSEDAGTQNSFYPQVLNHIQNLVIRECNHLSINLVLISHHPNFGISGNNKSAQLVRTIKANIDSYTVFKQGSRELRSFLSSISSGEDYTELKKMFSEAFRADSKFPEMTESGRVTIAPSITFSVNDSQLNFRENISNLNANFRSSQPFLPMSVMKSLS